MCVGNKSDVYQPNKGKGESVNMMLNIANNINLEIFARIC